MCRCTQRSQTTAKLCLMTFFFPSLLLHSPISFLYPEYLHLPSSVSLLLIVWHLSPTWVGILNSCGQGQRSFTEVAGGLWEQKTWPEDHSYTSGLAGSWEWAEQIPEHKGKGHSLQKTGEAGSPKLCKICRMLLCCIALLPCLFVFNIHVNIHVNHNIK